jgi:Ca2+-binding RTX toxin-like protein
VGGPGIPFSAVDGPDFDSGATLFSNGVSDNGDGTITIPAGVTSFTVTGDCVEDTTFEGTEVYGISVDGEQGTGTITDDDTQVTFSLTGATSVIEGESGVYTLSMVGAGVDPATHTGGITVDLTYTATGATGADYTQVTTVTFAAGVTSVDFSIDTIDDYFEELSAEDFTVSIADVSDIDDNGNFGGNVAIDGSDFSVTTEILDGVDVPGTVTPTAPENIAGAADTVFVKISGPSSIIEDDGANIYTVSLVDSDGNAVIALTGGVTVDLDFSGSAISGAGNDYTVSASSVTILAGLSSVEFTVTALLDGPDAESFTVDVGTITDNGSNFEYVAADLTASSVSTTILGTGADDLAVVHESALEDGSGKDETVFDADDESGQNVFSGEGSSTATGNLTTNDGVAVTEITDINGTGEVGGIITITNAIGTLAVVATAAGAAATGGAIGDFTYTLLGPVSNTVSGEEDIANEFYTYTYDTSSTTGSTAGLTVAIVDDEPLASSVAANVPVVEQASFDIAFVLDTSGSMGLGGFAVNLPDGTQTSRYALAIESIKALAAAFFAQSDDVEITLVTFATNATIWTPASGGNTFTTYDSFEIALGLIPQPGGGTNYEDALNDLQTVLGTFNSGAGVDAAADTLTYFISDGEPNTTDPVGDSGWGTFLAAPANATVKSYAVGIGTGLTDFAPLDAIHNVDLDGSGSENGAISVPDLTQLEAELLRTVPESFGGSVLLNSGVSTADFGADGGFIQSVTIELGGMLDVPGTPGTAGTPVTFTYDAVLNEITYTGNTGMQTITGNVLTLTEDNGVSGGNLDLDNFPFGKLLFDFSDGNYTYFAATDVIEEETFTLTFVAEDNDGDVSSQEVLTVTIADASPIAGDDSDTLFSNSDQLEGNVITGLGTDGGVSLGSSFTSFALQGEGVDYAVDGAMVTAINYRGVDIDFTQTLAAQSITATGNLAGDGTTFAITVTGTPINDVNGEYQIQIVNNDGSEVVFGSTGYYTYTPPVAPVNEERTSLSEAFGYAGTPTTFFEDFTNDGDAGDFSSALQVSATGGSGTVRFNDNNNGLSVNGGGRNDAIDNGEALIFDFSAYAYGVNDIILDFNRDELNASVQYTYLTDPGNSTATTTVTVALSGNDIDTLDALVGGSGVDYVTELQIVGGTSSRYNVQDLTFTEAVNPSPDVSIINNNGVVTTAVAGTEYLTIDFSSDRYPRGVEYVDLNFDVTDGSNGSAIFYRVDGTRLGSVTMDGGSLSSPDSFSNIGSIQIIPNGQITDDWNVSSIDYQEVPLVGDAPDLLPEVIEYTLSDFDENGDIDESDTATLTLSTVYNSFYGTGGDDNGIAGLLGKYYGSDYSDPTGGDLNTIAEALAIISGAAGPDATFLARELDYSISSSNNLGTGTSLEEFLGNDGSSLTTAPVDTSRGILHLSGFLNLAAGDYNFQATSDDGYSLIINGTAVISFDGNRAVGTYEESGVVTLLGGGQDTIEIIYWDNGGGADLITQYRPAGVGSYETITSAVTTIPATDSNDFISGGAGNDTFDGGGGADVIEGGTGNDILFGGAGDDNVVGGDGQDQLYGDADDDELIGGDGIDQLFGGTGEDTLLGGKGGDLLEGGDDDDQLFGNEGSDELYGEQGLDLLEGGAGDDVLDGGTQDDTLIGGLGDDELTGGTGDDSFVWQANEQGTFVNASEDIITDFSLADDVLDLSDLLQNEEDALSLDSYLRFSFTDSDGDTFIDTEIQIDHDGGAVFQTTQTIVLDGVDLSAEFGSTIDEVIITALINQNNLNIDT